MCKTASVYDGLGIILKYDKDAEISERHDEILAGGETLNNFSQSDLDKMDKLGWFWEDDEDCWTIFV